MAMRKHPAICSAEAGLKIKMYGCAIWPGQSTEDKIMQNYHKPVGTDTVRKESSRATGSTPKLSKSARSFPFYIRRTAWIPGNLRSGQSKV